MPFLKSHLKKFRPLWRDAEEKVVRNGFRIATFGAHSSKEKYMGQFKYDVKHGKGIQKYPDGTVYEGDWRYGHRNGHGILSRDCGNGIRSRIYTGLWENDTPSGFGLKNYPDGGLYKGEFKHGLRHGYGCMYYRDGSIHIGKWFKDLRSGVGRTVNPETGNFYEGMFRKDLKNGRGRYYHLITGQIQEGVWYEDQARVTWMWDDKKRREFAKKKTTFPIPKLELKAPHDVFHDAAQDTMERARIFGRTEPVPPAKAEREQPVKKSKCFV